MKTFHIGLRCFNCIYARYSHLELVRPQEQELDIPLAGGKIRTLPGLSVDEVYLTVLIDDIKGVPCFTSGSLTNHNTARAVPSGLHVGNQSIQPLRRITNSPVFFPNR